MLRSTFTRDVLVLFGPTGVWALHFILIYGVTGVVCARMPQPPVWAGLSALAWMLLVAAAAALLAMVLLLRVPLRGLAERMAFVRWVGRGLAALSAVAVVWETLTVFAVPACTTVS